MRIPRTRLRKVLVAAGIGTCAVLVASSLVATRMAGAAVSGLVRVDQVGFLPSDPKQAYLMVGGAVTGATFAVVDAGGATVLSGNVGGTSLGSWNSSYPDVYPISFTGLTAPGTYHITVGGNATGSSPTFTIQGPGSLYGKLVADGVSFFQTQRDGSGVIAGALNRQPAHLHDGSANVYAWPHFQSGTDTISDSDLSRTGGPVDVSGGWFDAGDYLKFTHTTAYGDALLFASERALRGSSPSTLDSEAHFGEAWLNRMWNQTTKTLYLQVGIGSGNAAGSFTGDHDLWRLPQNDDGDTASADRYAAAHRPVFQAAAAGAKVSPNLAGRVSAAFALAAQVDADNNPTQAAAEYQAATSLYAMANTAGPPNPLTTAQPNDYYPESTWHDDMEFGAAEIALAAQLLGHDDTPYLTDAATWARDYLTADTSDTFNLYDTSALAHADLAQALQNAGNPTGVAVTTTDLVSDLKRQVQTGATRAAADIFHAGGVYTDFDVDAHTFGFLATEALYRGLSHDTSFLGYATQQRDWLLGANAWGTSVMVGEGSTYPKCMQHQVSNLAHGSAVGAVVNGPNDTGQFTGGLGTYQDGMVTCPASGDPFNAFTGHGSRYVDDVRSWQSSEPALDMTGTAILGTALQEAADGGTNGGTYEAESLANTVTGNAHATSCAACSGNAKVGWVGTGSTLTYNNISVATPGSYAVVVAYCDGSTTGRQAQVSVNGGPAQTVTFTPTGSFGTPGMVTLNLTLAAGANTITFGNPTAYAPDLDALTVPGAPIAAITNGGFETGDLTGWSHSGTTSVTGSAPHSGTYAALTGSANPTNGDSKVYQTFTAPAGSSTVSFYYLVYCPDDVTYDWATATLTDNTTATTYPVLGRTCTLTNAWVKVSHSVTPGHSYTLTLVNHDENNPGDATDTKYDDVTIG